jgi:hypothetical protein
MRNDTPMRTTILPRSPEDAQRRGNGPICKFSTACVCLFRACLARLLFLVRVRYRQRTSPNVMSSFQSWKTGAHRLPRPHQLCCAGFGAHDVDLGVEVSVRGEIGNPFWRDATQQGL